MIAPIHLERLLEIACSPASESCPHVMRPTGTCTPLEELEQMGLIERDSHSYGFPSHGWRVTGKGQVYIEAVLDTPLPERTWKVFHRGNDDE